MKVMNDLSNHIALDQKYNSIGETRHLPSLYVSRDAIFTRRTILEASLLAAALLIYTV